MWKKYLKSKIKKWIWGKKIKPVWGRKSNVEKWIRIKNKSKIWKCMKI